MSTLTLELPDELANGLQRIVKSGWFTDEKEAIHAALRELLTDRRYALQERQQLEDIEWALEAKRTAR